MQKRCPSWCATTASTTRRTASPTRPSRPRRRGRGHPDPAAAAAAIAPTLRRGLLQIASGLKVGELIILDDPAQRGTGSALEKSEAFTFPAGDIHAVWVEPGFWGGGNTLTGATNWARIIVHELTHNYCQTVAQVR